MKEMNKYRFSLLILVIFTIVGAVRAQSTVFAPAVNYPTGDYPFYVKTGDFNGDGKADIVTANQANNAVGVMLGNGDGTFQPSIASAVGNHLVWIDTGDFNADNKTDLAVTSWFGNNVGVMLGNGDGTFQAPVYYTTGSHAMSVDAGDVNNDGKADLTVINYTCYQCASSLSILLGNGNGSFQNAVNYATGGYGSQSHELGDLNGDGKPDVIVSSADNNGSTVLKGNGDGTFQAPVNYPTGQNPVVVTLGDFNSDNILDSAVTNYFNNNVSVRFGNGDATFQAANNYGTGTNPGQVVTGDFDNNGKLDLAAVNVNGRNVSLLYNNGNGTFQSAANYAIGGSPFSLAAADFNGDGRLDLAAANRDDDNVSVLINGTTPAKPAPLPGLLGWWRGEGNSMDSSGTNHGALNGGATFAPGYDGYAFKFPDHNSQMKVNSQVYEMQGGSISAWINWDGIHQQNWIYSNVMFGSWQGGETSSPVVMVYYGTFWWQFSSTIYYGARWNTNIPVVPGRWYHVAMTYKDNTAIDGSYIVRLYIDGVQVDAANLNNPVDFRDEFGIGTAAGIGGGFSGMIDEVQIYNRPLSNCEVAFLHNANSGCGGGETTIDPQAYPRSYSIYNTDNNTLVGTFSGVRTLDLDAGNYLFDNGEGVGTSAFAFSVDQYGQVTGVGNAAAAEAVGNTLRLKNATITVNPQGYAGNYYFGPRNVFYTGTRSFTVVPGLRYGIDSGAGVGGAGGASYFYFDVGAGGAISNIDVPAAAYGSGSTLFFNNRTLIVEPQAYTGTYNLSSHAQVAASFSGRQSFVMIPGLIYTFDTGTGFYEQRFKLDAGGAPTNIEPAGFASGGSNVLVLANVPVHVDPTAYGGVYRLSGRTFSGAQDLILVPYTKFFVAVNNAAEYAVPTPSGVTPPSVTLNDNGNNHTFNFFPSQACTMPASGILGWWSAEGNGAPRVGTNTAVPGNGAQYAAGKVGQSFQFDGVNDYVDIGSFGVLPTYTVALWFNADVADRNRTFISQDRAGYNDDFMLGIEPEGDFYGNDYNRIAVVFHDDATVSRAKIRDTVDVVPGRWYFVAVTYDGATMRLWVDGIEKGSVTMSGLAISDQRWNLGQNAHYFPVGSYRNFAGRIDEPLIASRALTPSEINGVFMSGYTGSCGDLAAPDTSAVTSPAANAAGWFNSDVGVTLNAADGTGGSGVSQMVYSASGAQTISPTTVAGASANLTVTAEGETVISYYARDNAGNIEAVKTLTVKIDKTAPTITAARNPSANAAGWNNTDVTAGYEASDALSGLAADSPANGSFVFTSEGANQSHTFTVTDLAGNTASAGVENVNIDKTAPVVSCGTADGAWHAADVSIACTASGDISGLADAADADFTLVTSVPPGTETANASTGSREVCDRAGNCATAAPIGGNKVDKKAPTVTISSPAAGSYLLNQAVTVDYECTDNGSGTASCTGTTADGGLLDTSSTGAKTLTVNAVDHVGNAASPVSVNYTVGFAVQVLFDQTKAHKAGSTVPIKIRLTDANGVNVSSPATVVHAVSVVQTGSQASTMLEDAGNANPDFDFRYDASLGGYVFNLQTKGYATGTYRLNFIAANGAVIYSVQFQVRQ